LIVLMLVAVVGGGTCSPAEAALAREVGARLAEAGIGVVCGGGGGVMAAACEGAGGAGGLTIGILPGNDRTAANPWVDIALPTGLGEARNTLVVRSARAVIAIGGEFGTLSEIAFALKLGIPVIGLDTWALHKHGQAVPAIRTVTTAAEAVTAALHALGKPS
jgi:hypothetical protein